MRELRRFVTTSLTSLTSSALRGFGSLRLRGVFAGVGFPVEDWASSSSSSLGFRENRRINGLSSKRVNSNGNGKKAVGSALLEIQSVMWPPANRSMPRADWEKNGRWSCGCATVVTTRWLAEQAKGVSLRSPDFAAAIREVNEYWKETPVAVCVRHFTTFLARLGMIVWRVRVFMAQMILNSIMQFTSENGGILKQEEVDKIKRFFRHPEFSLVLERPNQYDSRSFRYQARALTLPSTREGQNCDVLLIILCFL